MHCGSSPRQSRRFRDLGPADEQLHALFGLRGQAYEAGWCVPGFNRGSDFTSSPVPTSSRNVSGTHSVEDRSRCRDCARARVRRGSCRGDPQQSTCFTTSCGQNRRRTWADRQCDELGVDGDELSDSQQLLVIKMDELGSSKRSGSERHQRPSNTSSQLTRRPAARAGMRAMVRALRGLSLLLMTTVGALASTHAAPGAWWVLVASQWRVPASRYDPCRSSQSPRRS